MRSAAAAVAAARAGRDVVLLDPGGHIGGMLSGGLGRTDMDRPKRDRGNGPAVSCQEFSTLKKPLPLAGDPFGVGDENRVSVWADLLLPEED